MDNPEQTKKKKYLYSAILFIVLIFGLGFFALRSYSAKLASTKPVSLPNNSPITVYNQKKADADPTCPIKAKDPKKGKKIYHVPGGLSYKRIKADKCFKTEDEAIAAGFTKAAR